MYREISEHGAKMENPQHNPICHRDLNFKSFHGPSMISEHHGIKKSIKS